MHANIRGENIVPALSRMKVSGIRKGGALHKGDGTTSVTLDVLHSKSD